MLAGEDLAARGRCICAPLLMILALATPISQASEPRTRIRYAEPIEIQASTLPGDARTQSATTIALLRFDAYGRRFELQLESNDRLLRRLPATRRAELPPHDLYRGKLTGLPRSWVRLSRLPDGIYGAIWDGSEFYSIAPAHALIEFMGGATPPTSDQPLIYRASDVEVLGGPRFCAVLDPTSGAGKPVTGLDQYKSLLRELPRTATAAAVATLELEVAMIADFEFFSAEVDPASALLSRLNVVDGIFSEQVGVAITASELKVFDDPADPFTTSDAGTLLDQVGRYRVATPAIAATGLAHLVTGRNLTKRNAQNNLDDSIIGIAYLFGVCEAEIGVSVSERLDPFTSALVAAHEFGHNFGAPHDGETGSPCQATGLNFLMAPRLNDSSTFSQCSRNQMAPVIAESSCIRARQYIDLAVQASQTHYSGHTRNAETIQFDVVNRGTRTAEGAIASVDLDPSLTPTSISAEGGSCTVEFGDIACQLGSIPAGGRRTVRFDVTALGPGSTSSSIAVAIDDDDQGNNHGAFTFAVAAATDASISAVAPSSLTVLSGDVVEISYRVAVTGITAVDAATVRTTAPGFVILSAAPESGACSVTSSLFATCTLGPIALGSTRRVTLRVRTVTAGDRQIRHELEADIDDTGDNNRAFHNIRINPLVDLVIEGDASAILLLRGETLARTFMVRSIGPMEARGASFSVRWTNEIVEVIAIDAEDATCTLQPGTSNYVCRFAAAIGSGKSRQVDVVFRAAKVGTGSITASVAATDNQHFAGPLSTRLDIPVESRESADVRLEPEFDTSHYENRPFFVSWRMQSIGLTSAQDVRLTLSLPAGITVLSAEPSSGSCMVAMSPVRCDFGSLDHDHTAWVLFSVQGDRPGNFVLTAEATAANDADATNNLDTMTVALLPNFDVRVTAPPALERIKIGNRARYPVEIRSSSQPVSNVQVRITSWNLDVDVVSIAQGSCVHGSDAIDCALDTLPANTTVPIEIEIQGLEPGSANITVEAHGDLDIDSTNDHFGEMLLVAPLGNASIEISSASRTARVGEPFESPAIMVRALQETDAVHLRINVPSGLIIESVAQHSGPCTISHQTVDCDFGDLHFADRRDTFMHLRATEAGSFTIVADVIPLDDSDSSDNSASVTVNVDAAPGSQPDPPASSGGGGGGSLDWATLMLGAVGVGLRCRRRPGAAGVSSAQVNSGRCSAGPAH